MTILPLHNVDRAEVIKGIGDARYGNVLGADYQEMFGFPSAGRTAGVSLRAGL